MAMDKEELGRIGISHLLNAAQGSKFNQIDTTEAYYADLGLKFLDIPAIDVARFKLTPYFQIAADFIQDAIESGGKSVWRIPFLTYLWHGKKKNI